MAPTPLVPREVGIAHIKGEVEAHAKLNLRLKVEGRRDDGYHLLSMLNVTTEFGDSLFLATTPERGVSLKVTGEVPGVLRAELEDPEMNAAGRAATRFLDGLDLPYGIQIHIEKRIPAQAGLGGGSSDAAGVLRWLAHTCPGLVPERGYAEEELYNYARKVALTIGADVPYLLSGGFAHVKGIGEDVRPLDASFLSGVECLLIHPPIQVSTPELFQRLRDNPRPWHYDVAAERFTQEQASADRSRYLSLLALIENDLTEAIFDFAPRLADIHSRLSGVDSTVVSVTGSGSALFMVPRHGPEFTPSTSRDVERILRDDGCRIVRTRLCPGVVFAPKFL